MDYQTILVAEEGPVTVVTLNRPEALNVINQQMASELVDLFSVLAGR